MTRRWPTVLAALSVLPPVVAVAAWYLLAVAAGPSGNGFVPPGGNPLPEAFDEWHWALNLLPPVAMLLPVLPVVVIGRELGRRHQEDYTGSIVALGLTVCAVALGLGLLFDLGHTPRGRFAGPAEQVGRTAEVMLPGTCAVALIVVWGAAVDRRRKDRLRRSQWMCVGCGYSLRGNPWRCPECGRTYVPMGPPPKEPAGVPVGRRQ